MQIPRMSVEATRNLLDLGIREVFQLQGRAPEVLFEDALEKNEGLPADRVRFFRMAVYYAETEQPDPKQLHPDFWT
ncbi:MAG: Pathogenicity locus [Verrucomicrobia bacterium]|nr:Pathogenicity locus [Verrucomicrobiota bacterium]